MRAVAVVLEVKDEGREVAWRWRVTVSGPDACHGAAA